MIELLAGSLKFRLVTLGPPEAVPLLLLGHVPDPSFALDGLGRALAELQPARRIVIPERIDVGADPHFHAIAGDIAKLIEALGCARVDIAGVGFGGTVAVLLATMAPQLVRALALIDAPLPNLHSLGADLTRRMAESYAYVADFLDPGFEASVADGDVGLLTQFWERAAWWTQQEARYRAEIAKPDFVARVAAAYRANFTLVEDGTLFTAEDEQRVSAFGRRTRAVHAGQPRRHVASSFAAQLIRLSVPSLYDASCAPLLPPELSSREFLNRFLSSPRIVTGDALALGVHVGDPAGVAAIVVQFFQDIAAIWPLADEALPDKVRESRDSHYIVGQYDAKIRHFRCPAIHAGKAALRGSHPKTHGVVRGRFIVDAGLPLDLRVGLFAKPETSYECVARFSSLGKPELEAFADSDRDVRGAAIKLMGKDDDGAPITLCDFLLNSVPVLSTRRGRDVVPQRLDFMDLERQLLYADDLKVDSVFAPRYFSITPYRYGPGRAVKYVLVPGPEPAQNDSAPDVASDASAPDFLRHRLEHVLAHATADVVFDFCIQFQTDPVRDPIEDPRVEWSGPLVKIAELRFPPQIANEEENAAHDEALAFHLYHCPQEHAPLGEVNRSRRAVYSTSPALRRKLNEQPRALYPHRPKPLEVCVVGSGVAGLGAAMALSRFGHRVTVVERRTNLGGHACSVELPGGHSVDPAFGSFTAAAYPNVAKLFTDLQVEVEELGSFKEALTYFSLDRRRSWRHLEDIPFARHVLEELERFDAWGILADENLDFVTARDYFAEHGFSEEFIHYAFLGSVVFVFVGQPANYYLDYPIRQLVKYAYLPVVMAGREPVCRVKQGSASYIERLTEMLVGQGVRFLAATNTEVLSRDPEAVTLRLSQRDAQWEQRFDHVVLAAAPHDSLKVLGAHARDVECEILAAMPVTRDTVIVHRDPRYMPANRDEWRHANMIVADESEDVDRDRPFMLTKWTKSNTDRATDVFATYAYNRKLDIEGGVPVTFEHVKVTPDVVRLRRRLRAVQGQGRVWFCGSWARAFTLHEDGLVSGLEAANGILAGLEEYPIIKAHEFGAASRRAPWGPHHTILDVLEYQARLHASKRALVFVDDACAETEALTYGELMRRAHRVAAALTDKWNVQPGDRVLLIYVPGLDFIVALLGAMMAGALPVPAYPPNPKDLGNDLRKISSIVESSGARLALTSRSYRRMARIGSVLSPSAAWQWPRGLTWRTTDDIAAASGEPPAPTLRATADDVAFLQFTSGSTAEPRGVIISHSNLMHQLALIAESLGLDDTSIGCCWVPQYHDLGLVGCIFTALYNGATLAFCSPLSFLRDPSIWPKMLHRYRATATAAPDFGYSLLLKRTTAEQRAHWDLSNLRVAMCAGEAIHYETLRDFTQGFAASGLEAKAFCPAYGLAEHVVAVTIGGTRLYHLDKSELALRNRVRLGEHRIVGCGKPADHVAVAIVDPETRRRCDADSVGEIWVSSGCKARGYYGQPELSREVFQARIEGEKGVAAERDWLRTGDLGFMHHGELFITGRRKDLIILRGRNIYPVDVERAAEAASAHLRPGCSAVFLAEEDHEDSLVLCAELRKSAPSSWEDIAADIRREVMKREGVHLGTVALLEARSVPKTTSGKVRRGRCRELWMEGGLKFRLRDKGVVSLNGSGSRNGSAAHRGVDPARNQPVLDAGPALAAVATPEDMIHAAVCEVTRMDVARDLPLADQVNLDSVEYVSLVTLIEQRLNVRLPVTILNRYPTIALLAEYLRTCSDVVLTDPSVVTLNDDTDEAGTPHLFLIHPARGGVECYLELARRLDIPITAIRQIEYGTSVEELAARYVAAIKTVRPQGPYLLGGYSFGATVSRAMALALERQGETVSGLILLDEIHRPPVLSTSAGRGDRGALLYEIARSYLSAPDLHALDDALAANGDSRMEPVLAALADATLRDTIAEQVRCYQHNVGLAEAYDAPPPGPPMILLRTANSYHRAPQTMARIAMVPGDHFTMLRPPHVETVAALVLEALAELTRIPQLSERPEDMETDLTSSSPALTAGLAK
jgi:acyl-CoA synthetase (AMP-forming)/AMP-acid ligase II/predicted NAD/FAD-binding protein/thioesterase domain-containing protein/acyl carrier protein